MVNPMLTEYYQAVSCQAQKKLAIGLTNRLQYTDIELFNVDLLTNH